jgi:hypothetical protein
MTERTPITTPALPGGLPFDATQIQFTQGGTGAVARSVQSKERDIYSAKDDGAVGDGVTDDKTKISNAMADSTVVLLPNNGTYVCASRLNIPSSLIGPATLKSTGVATGGDFGITGSNVTIRDVTFTGSDESGGQMLFFNAANLDRVFLDHIRLSNTLGATAQIGFQASNASLTRLTLRDADIRTSGFAFLLNSGATNAASVELNGGYYYSKLADAINFNAPAVSQLDVSIVGANTQSDASFSIAIAGAKNVSIIGGTSSGSLLQDIHIEDTQNNVSITGRVIRGCQGDGIHILNNSNTTVAAGSFVVGTAYTILVVGTTSFTSIGASANTIGVSFIATGVGSGTGTATANPGGVIVSNNQIRAAAGNVSDGVNLVSDGSGTVDGCCTNGNHIYGFQRAIALGSALTQTCEGNVVENATDAYFAVGPCQHSGVNYARNCTNLVVIHTHGVFGKVISSTKPTAILVKETVTNSPAMMQGFAFPSSSFNHGGTGIEWTTLFPVGDRMQGKIEVYVNFANADTASIMEDFDWTGAALTQGKVYTVLAGVFTAVDLRVNGGNVQIGITSAVARTGLIAQINFDGQYWKV